MQPTRFGRIRPPDEAWLAKQPPEPILGKRDEVFASWKDGISELATCPNVVMKLGA